MKIGIPRAFLYYRYRYLWEVFFKELGCNIILSPDTNKEILKAGSTSSIDESCLSSKIYLGHVEYLIDKCDYILIPRIASYGRRQIVCSKFQAAYDVVNNTFKDRDINLLDYNIDYNKKETEFKAFMKIGKTLKKSKFETIRAYFMAKQSEKMMHDMAVKEQEQLLKREDKLKILIVAHAYNVYDKYVGDPVIEYLKELDCIPIIAEVVERETAVKKAKAITPTLQWNYNKELVGAIELYKEQVDGIILMTSFPCGPDSLVNEMIIRKNKDKPIINLILDEQEGTAGRETRIESFIDIIRIKKGELNEDSNKTKN